MQASQYEEHKTGLMDGGSQLSVRMKYKHKVIFSHL